MPQGTGFDLGSWLPGPLITRFRPEGKRAEFPDTAFGYNPFSRYDIWEDFAGPFPIKTLYILPIAGSSVANQFATTGASTVSIMADFSGYLLDARMTAEDALAASDTNYLTFTLTNEGQDGSGTVAMLAGTDANTTKATGGTAITAETGRSFTLNTTAANLRVAPGDLITFKGTATGTLANFVDRPVVRLQFATLPSTVSARTTKTVGTVAAQPVDDTATGEALFQLSGTAEANVVGFDWGDRLLIPATRGPIFTVRLKVSGAAASTRYVWGLGSAYNATLDNITSNAWFRIEGNSLSLLAETDDGTTDNDDQSTGFTLTADTYYTFRIDMRDLGNVGFWVHEEGSGSGWNLVKELNASKLTESNLLQPFVLLQKDSGTGTESVTVDAYRLEFSRF